uniref:CUB domain-containing protein n=1 Tax=Noctiluca scintillans TaxID=2966 RepID=A0A7S1FCK8_NOCSC|mmetsp:Transcript_4997/g.13797  ORF Transcript_4997/g.13797 Transcript_4997/m.13797 type:complete len:169 (+) Transcript_4997:1-507(+)
MCTQPYTPPPPSSWRVLSEDGYGCGVSANCVTSPHYPGNYGFPGRCVLAVKENATVHVDHFDTDFLDMLTIGSVQLHGNVHVPDLLNISVFPSTSIAWTSNGPGQRKGWSMCTGPYTPPPPSDWMHLVIAVVVFVGTLVICLAILCGSLMCCQQGDENVGYVEMDAVS